MDKLRENIVNACGGKAGDWLQNLPGVVNILSRKWNLSWLKPIGNIVYTYVASGIKNRDEAIVLKIGMNKRAIEEELSALNFFNGNYCISPLDYDREYNALLLRRTIPGITLRSFYPQNFEYVVQSYADLMKNLHAKSLLTRHRGRYVGDWLKAIDNATVGKVPQELLQKAVCLKNNLLKSSATQTWTFLHGDLHLDNILQDKHGWIAIDPKGVIGELEFEAAAFDLITKDEISTAPNIQDLFSKRLTIFARNLNLNAIRIRDWTFVKLVLWASEDASVPEWVLNFAKWLYTRIGGVS